MTKPTETQLKFDFGTRLPAVAVKKKGRAPSRRHPNRKVEIISHGRLEPVDTPRKPADVLERPAGHHETTAFQLYLRMHEAMIKALVRFAFCTGLVLLVKGGLPIQEAALKELKLNIVTNNKLFTGLVGLLALFFAGLAGHYANRASMLARKCGVPFQQMLHPKEMTFPALLSHGTTAVGFALTVSGLVAVIYLAFWDIVALLRFMIEHLVEQPRRIGEWITSISKVPRQ